MTQLAALVSLLWRAAQALAILARLACWITLAIWARILYLGALALAWVCAQAGGRVYWQEA